MISEKYIKTETGGELCLYELQSQKPKGLLCLIHGAGSHSGRFFNLMELASEKGYSCFALDLPGHGKSYGERGMYVARDRLFDYMDLLIERAAKSRPGLPVFLLGHSMGGALTLGYRLRRGGTVSGYVAASPMLRLKNQKYGPLERTLLTPLAKLWPRLIIPTRMRRSDLGDGDLEDFDPYLHSKTALGTVTERVEDAEAIFAGASLSLPPVCLEAGSEDRVCDLSVYEDLSRRLGGLCTYTLWEGQHHDVWEGPDSEMVILHICEWMDKIRENLEASS